MPERIANLHVVILGAIAFRLPALQLCQEKGVSKLLGNVAPLRGVRALSRINVRRRQIAQSACAEGARKEPMGLAITLAQYLLDRDVAYEPLPHRHTETALGSATASGLPADSVVKAVGQILAS